MKEYDRVELVVEKKEYAKQTGKNVVYMEND